MAPPSAQPTPEHRAFTAAAFLCDRLGPALAHLDLPDDVAGIQSGRPTLLAGNHRSLFDLVACLATFRRVGLSGHILVQERYLRKGPLAAGLARIGCIPISREQRERAEDRASASLSDRHLVAIMPEGRVVPPEEWVDGVGPVRPGVGRLALRTEAQVVAIGFAGTEVVWPRGERPKLPRPGRGRPTVVLRASRPFVPTGDEHEATDQILAVLRETVARAEEDRAARS